MWRQIIADILKVECVFAKSSKGAPVGNAVAAGVGLGLYKDYDVVKQWVKYGEKHTPIPENAALYDRLYPVYRNLYPQVQSSFRDVAEALRG
jgi:xylulokinase